MSMALEEYMKIAVCKRWETSEVGAKLEAFAIAGCDVVSESQIFKTTIINKNISDLMQTSKQKADHIKWEIREKISIMLGALLNLLLS